MAKLTKKQIRDLERVMDELVWGTDFILSPDVVVAKTCRTDDVLAYLPANQSALEAGMYPAPAIHSITKDIGSPVAGVFNARKALQTFINLAKAEG